MKMHDKTDRFYRYQHQQRHGWTSFQAQYRETDLWIRAERNLQKEALEVVLNLRHQLENYIYHHPEFLHSLSPLPQDPLAPAIIRRMLQAGIEAGVGPMAAVAGAVAEAVALSLKPYSPSIIVENGGDCYLDLPDETIVGIYAGPRSPFSGKLALRFAPERFPLGICTSSGTIGHSLSFGRADAITVVAKDTALADAAATALGNVVKGAPDIQRALDLAASIPSIEGTLILIGERMGAIGDLEFVPA